MTRAGPSVAVCLALLAGAPARAQTLPIPSVDADPTVLLACIGSGKSAKTCLGAMTLDCMAENDIGNDNLEERLCTVEELVVWRDLLARARGRLERRLRAIPASDHPVLLGDPVDLSRDASWLWRQWVDGQCRLERATQGHGDRRAIVQDICLRDHTSARYAGLRRLLDQLGQQ